jgi:hypothetical protein
MSMRTRSKKSRKQYEYEYEYEYKDQSTTDSDSDFDLDGRSRNSSIITTPKWTPSKDQINEHNRILTLEGDSNNVVYSALATIPGNDFVYVRTGSVRSQRTLLTRIKEHLKEFDSFCLFQVVKCTDAEGVESDFKKLPIVSLNQRTVKSKTISQTEMTLLSETVTSKMLGNLVLSVGNESNRIIPSNSDDFLGYYLHSKNSSLSVEREKTKQFGLQLKQKEIELLVSHNELEKIRLNKGI